VWRGLGFGVFLATFSRLLIQTTTVLRTGRCCPKIYLAYLQDVEENMPVIISIVGKSGSGKTTLIEKLLPELKNRGYRIGTIKHAAHQVEMDREGKDSWRHRKAGADTVLVVSPKIIAMVKNAAGQDLEELDKYFDDTDIVLTEGFKSGDKPKIEVFRAAVHSEILCRDDAQLVAIVTDSFINTGVPVFGLEDIGGLADFIVARYILDRLPSDANPIGIPASNRP
jgi:molybdopterin-guanine dinucleotide biosynthesis protein B